MFIDEARIYIKAGDGGDGCMAFRREKYVPRGGPSGGDGGKGGDVRLRASQRHNTLVHYRFQPEHRGERGGHGEGSNRTGHHGQDRVLPVPVGTLAFDADSGELLHDFAQPDESVVLARGGRGGRGNARFATSIRQAPRRFERGFPGQERRLRLELKLLADIGLVGYPNVGKSTLISRLSSARPKIADYPFTTLEPNLGVVVLDEFDSFVLADVPGLTEGAHLGRGLGARFLRHLERTRLLAHLIDVSAANPRDPIHDYHVITDELASFNPALAQKPLLVVASKIDAAQNPERIEHLASFCRSRELPFFAISAVTGAGLDELKFHMAERVREARLQQMATA